MALFVTGETASFFAEFFDVLLRVCVKEVTPKPRMQGDDVDCVAEAKRVVKRDFRF